MTKYNKFFLATIFLASLAISGCSNTFEGAGRDMQNAGVWMEDTF